MPENRPAPQAPYVGMPASILYVTDTRAAVVTKVTPRTVLAALVETGPERQDMRCDPGAYGIRPTIAAGILDQPIEGTERRYTLTKRGRYEHQGTPLLLGTSVSRTDWRL